MRRADPGFDTAQTIAIEVRSAADASGFRLRPVERARAVVHPPDIRRTVLWRLGSDRPHDRRQRRRPGRTRSGADRRRRRARQRDAGPRRRGASGRLPAGGRRLSAGPDERICGGGRPGDRDRAAIFAIFVILRGCADWGAAPHTFLRALCDLCVPALISGTPGCRQNGMRMPTCIAKGGWVAVRRRDVGPLTVSSSYSKYSSKRL